MKTLPIGIQSFVKLRTNDYLYVDKTEIIHHLISKGEVYFLSRPRRFGKSLLISTLEELFKGNKSIFQGLAIYDKWDWSKQHAVIRIDWSLFAHKNAEEMTISTLTYLKKIASDNEISLSSELPSACMGELLEQLYQKTGNQVVVLIDEYDKPILDALTHPRAEQEEIRTFLNSFYGILKGVGEHLRFVFLTGVSRFSGVSIFSGLNNLNDISLDDDFATICGYTQKELEDNFSEYIDATEQRFNVPREKLLEGIRTWYDGYSWDGASFVYNPFSTLLFFSKKIFRNYWFSTATPTFLIEILKKRNALQVVLEPFTTGLRGFEAFNPDQISEVPLLFQTGYLTVKKRTVDFTQTEYTLGVSNLEVNESLLEYLLNAYSAYPVDHADGLKERTQAQLRDGDTAGLEKSIREMLAYVPYPLRIEKEAYYHSLLLVWIRLLGFDIQGEIMTNIGRIDAVWQIPGQIVIAEIKFSGENGKTEELLTSALTQIKERRYTERYQDGRRISLLAIAFSGEKIACKMEKQ